MTSSVVEANGLKKAFGKVTALDGLTFHVPRGSVLGLLGPNGSGKTTTVSILSTSLRPDAGRAAVRGLDVVTRARDVRRVIGFAGQFAAVDPNLTGRENQTLIGRLSRVGRKQARIRAAELLEEFGLSAAADRLTRTYSGGMRRRLDLAAALLHQPPVLFLDEPTTGLDPESRLALWESVRGLAPCRRVRHPRRTQSEVRHGRLRHAIRRGSRRRDSGNGAGRRRLPSGSRG
jgi:ABC-type multidrug transport system ATPase subunit